MGAYHCRASPIIDHLFPMQVTDIGKLLVVTHHCLRITSSAPALILLIFLRYKECTLLALGSIQILPNAPHNIALNLAEELKSALHKASDPSLLHHRHKGFAEQLWPNADVRHLYTVA